MAVSEQTPYIEYTANGIAKSFALEFDCENQDHLIVLVDDLEPVVGTWSLSSGAVVFTVAPAVNKKITIQRNTPFERERDYQSYDNSFRPPAVNKDFDWIWLKLQELGVADWILGNRIDALKNYVDLKDDELRAYLMEEIRKQGVALDQLDDYYNYLMERLAQIAVDKGWDASFVIDGDKTQKQVNDEQLAVNNATYSTVESVADMLAIDSPKNKQKVQTLSFYSGLGRGGAYYIYDTTKSAINNGITIINGWVLQWDGKNLDLLQAGCYGDGDSDTPHEDGDSDTPHEDGVKMGQCLAILSALGGGSLQGRGRTYLNETTNYEINTDNVFAINAKFKRATTKNGWMFQTATTKEINGGGFIAVEGVGNNTVVAGSAFINTGTNTYKHNRYVLRDIVADGWSQYGIGILGGDHWYAENIKVLNHGLVSGSMSACMGFYVYPRNPGGSKGGDLKGIYSEMSAGAIANASLNSAAIKLQTHQLANFSDITAIGGYEQCLGIDSVDGNIKDVFVYPQGERPGLVLGNYNDAHEFSGQKFTLDGFRVTDALGSSGTNAMLIGAGKDGQYKLNGCSIKNGTARRFKSLTLTAYRNCAFENIKCEDIRLSASFQSLTNNSVLSTGNTFINVRATDSVFAIETHDSEITDSGNTQKVASTGAVILGNGNIFKSFVGSADSSPLAIRGNNSIFISPILKGVTRAAWFQAGTMGNKIISPIYLNSAVVLNNGDATNRVEFVKAQGLTPTSTSTDIVTALQFAGLAT